MSSQDKKRGINMKAKFLRKYYDIENNPVLIYKYRGIEYEVVDRSWKGGEPLS